MLYLNFNASGLENHFFLTSARKLKCWQILMRVKVIFLATVRVYILIQKHCKDHKSLGIQQKLSHQETSEMSLSHRSHSV